MTTLLAISITTGILSGVWGWIAISLGLLSWAGFLGCTSYFAAPTSGLKGLATSLITNLTGVFWAMVIIYGSTYAGLEILGYVITAVVAFFHVYSSETGLASVHSWYFHWFLRDIRSRWQLATCCSIACIRWRIWLLDESNRTLVTCEINRYFFFAR